MTLVILFASLSAQGQTHKCTEADGKVTYSDAVCPNTAATAAVKTDRMSTLDMSGSRKQSELAANAKAEREKSIGAKSAAKKPGIFDQCDERTKGWLITGPTAAQANAHLDCMRAASRNVRRGDLP
jgi:hypothetical protein